MSVPYFHMSVRCMHHIQVRANACCMQENAVQGVQSRYSYTASPKVVSLNLARGRIYGDKGYSSLTDSLTHVYLNKSLVFTLFNYQSHN